MLKKLLIFLLALILIAGGAFGAWFYLNIDNEGPEIYINSNIVYNDELTEEELLDGVIALDASDGDVTSSLTIDSITLINDDQVEIVYAASDSKNNVSTNSVILKAEVANTAEAELPEEPEVEEPAIPVLTEEEQQMAEEAKAAQEAIADDMAAGLPRVYLNTYVDKVFVGTEVDLSQYVKDIKGNKENIFELWNSIQVEDVPDTSVAGTYETKFYVTDPSGNKSNEAILKLIVE